MEGPDPIGATPPNDPTAEQMPPGRRLPPAPSAVETFLRDAAKVADRILDNLDPLADRVADALGLRKPPKPPV